MIKIKSMTDKTLLEYEGENLEEADLEEADLREANLQVANLRRAFNIADYLVN